jgi:hypothetical protein
LKNRYGVTGMVFPFPKRLRWFQRVRLKRLATPAIAAIAAIPAAPGTANRIAP